MSGEQQNEAIIEHEGDRYLRLLGLEHLAAAPIATPNGPIEARNFLDVCGNHARPMLIGFESMDPADPRYEVAKNAIRGLINRYVSESA